MIFDIIDDDIIYYFHGEMPMQHHQFCCAGTVISCTLREFEKLVKFALLRLILTSPQFSQGAVDLQRCI